MPRKVKVVERKLGREGVDGQVFFADALIEIDPRLPPKAWLSTLVHEAVHLAFPNLPEKQVLAAEKQILGVLWRAGVRRVHVK